MIFRTAGAIATLLLGLGGAGSQALAQYLSASAGLSAAASSSTVAGSSHRPLARLIQQRSTTPTADQCLLRRAGPSAEPRRRLVPQQPSPRPTPALEAEVPPIRRRLRSRRRPDPPTATRRRKRRKAMSRPRPARAPITARRVTAHRRLGSDASRRPRGRRCRSALDRSIRAATGSTGGDPRNMAAFPPEVRPETGPKKALPPQFRRTLVDYHTKEPAGTLIVDTPEYLPLSRARPGQGVALWHRRGPRGLHLVGRRAGYQDGGVAGLASAGGNDRAPALPAALHGRRRRQPARRARALSRQDDLSHPRHQSAVDHRHLRVVGLHPAHQRGRRRTSTPG